MPSDPAPKVKSDARLFVAVHRGEASVSHDVEYHG
jgi:hypothetical protein